MNVLHRIRKCNVIFNSIIYKALGSYCPIITIRAPNSKSLSITESSIFKGYLGGSDGKESAYNAGDLGSLPLLGRSPGERNVNPLLYSCLGNLTDRGA